MKRIIIAGCVLSLVSGCGMFQRVPPATEPAPAEDIVLEPGVPLDQMSKDPAPSEGVVVPGDDAALSCAADQFIDAIGQSSRGLSFPPNTRVLGPNQFGTTDFVPERMTVNTDASGVITRVTCG